MGQTYPEDHAPKRVPVPYHGGSLLLWLLQTLQVTGKPREEAAQPSLEREGTVTLRTEWLLPSHSHVMA